MTLTLRAHGPEDLLAAVPVVLGFRPSDSVVMLTFGGRRAFHARIDLPGTDEADGCVAALMRPALEQEVTRAAFVLYSADDPVVRRVARRLRDGFTAAGIDVVTALQVHGGRYYLPLGGGDVPAQGVPLDLDGHPFLARAVLDGIVVEQSRDHLVSRLRPDPPAVAALEEALPGAVPLTGPLLRHAVDRHLSAGGAPDAAEASGVLLGVADPVGSHHAWWALRRSDASRHVAYWTELVRRAPDGLVAGPAAILALAAWADGNGALAWCAVDRCREEEPEHPLAGVVAHLLELAVPPGDDWFDRLSPDGAG